MIFTNTSHATVRNHILHESLVETRMRPRILAILAMLALVSPACAEDWDLSGLPSYGREEQVGWQPPAANLGGVIRIKGLNLTFHLIHLWQDAFLKIHPEIRYRDSIIGLGFAGLCWGTMDIAVEGHEAWRPNLKAFEEVYGYEPLEILVATGALDQKATSGKTGLANSPGVIVFVHKDNPLTGLSVKQLDGIFGAQRTGGWQGTRWSAEAARGPEENIRTWGQLGLTGEWARQPIRIYGTDATQSLWAGTIQRVVFQGGDKWNPAINELVRGDQARGPSDVQIVTAVAGDRYAIGFGFMRVIQANPDVKPLALAPREGGAYIAPTNQSFFDRTYPLVTGVYMCLNRPPGRPLSPRLKEFVRFVLSREGQQAVVDDGMYIPLNPGAAREQLKKLE